MKTKLLSCAALSATLTSGIAATPPKVIEAQRRMDPTGMGSFHRIGLLREAETTRRLAAKAADKKTGISKR
ncbi:MAG: hypothetical protein ACK5TH_12030 [Prosthecobacter sp.]|jgi:hypothetical protein